MARLTESAEVREEIVRALRLDLIGPWAGHPLADERLPGWVRPSNWYLTGFLVPGGCRPGSAAMRTWTTISMVAESAGLGDDSVEDRKAAKKGFFPSSMGLSFLVDAEVDSLEVVVRWGDYRRVQAEDDASDQNRDDEAETERGAREERATDGEKEPSGDDKADGVTAEIDESSVRNWWERTPREEPVPVILPATGGDPRPLRVPNSEGLTLHVVARPVNAGSFAGRIAPGTRSVSLFLVNGREPSSDRERDETFAFQAEIEVRSEVPFVPRPDPREVTGDDRDERIADLHYANSPEYAAGHGVSADWELVEDACRVLRTTWTPAAEVEMTETFDVPGTELDMQALGALADGTAAEAALTPLVTEYRSWIEARRAGLGGLAGERLATADASANRRACSGTASASPMSWSSRRG